MNRSHRYFFEPYPIWFGTNFPFRPLEMSNSCYGVPLSNGRSKISMEIVAHVFLRRWRISEKSLKISDCTLCLWFTLIYSDLLWTFRVIPEQRLSGPPLKQLWVVNKRPKKNKKEQNELTEEPAIEHFDLLVGRICESFDAVFSRYLSFRSLYRHSGSTDMFFMFFMFIQEANHWKRITRWYLYSWPFLIVCCHGVPFSISIFDT